MEKMNEDFTNLYKRWKSGNVRKEDEIEFIDLDLPSGLLWANRNVGAGDVLDSGMFLAWGEYKEKEIYNPNTYTFDVGQYNANKKLYLDEDIVKKISPVGSFIPSWKDYSELFKNTKIQEVENYNNSGVNVMLFTPKKCRKKNKPTLIFPLCGYKLSTTTYMEDSISFLWTSEFSNEYDKADCAKIGLDTGVIANIRIYTGCNIRCVKYK